MSAILKRAAGVNFVPILAWGWVITLLVLVIMGLWQNSRYSKLRADTAVVSSNYEQAKTANESNQKTIGDLRDANARIAEQRAADLVLAQEAAKRLEEANAALTKQVAENKLLRDKLAQENPDVKAYLRTGMPCELARQLWPKARYCQNRDG